MMKIPHLIQKLSELEQFYPNIDVDIDKLVLHMGITDVPTKPYVTFGKEDRNVSTEEVLLG